MIRSRQRNNKIISQPIFFALVIAILLLLVQFFFPRIFTSAFSYFFSPLWSGKDSIIGDMTPREQLAKENDALQEELAMDETTASSSKALLDENDELRQLLGRPESAKDLVLADVIRRPPGAGYDYLVIDLGSADGVSNGDFVYSAGMTAIGQVVEADMRSSKVELYSSHGTDYEVLIGASHIPATASGQGGGFFSTSLSQESGVSVGDEIIIPAISSSPFSSVSAIISDPAQPFEKVLFGSGTNPYQSLFLLVGVEPTIQRPFIGFASTTSATSTISTTSAKTTHKAKSI